RLLSVGTAPSSGLYITRAGNAGVGTTAPAYELDVTGDIRSTGTIYVDLAGNLTGGYAAAGWVDDGGVVRLETDADNVGIGLTNPNAKLQVNGTINATAMNVGANAVLDEGTSFAGDVTGPWDSLEIASGVVGATELASTAVSEGDYGNATQVAQITVDADGRLTSASNVSISFPAEDDPEVGELADNVVPYWNGTTLVNGSMYDVSGNVGIGTTAPGAALQIQGLGSDAGFALRIADNASTDRLVVLDNGNVGIGTTAPGAELDVNGHLLFGNGTENSSAKIIMDSYDVGGGEYHARIYPETYTFQRLSLGTASNSFYNILAYGPISSTGAITSVSGSNQTVLGADSGFTSVYYNTSLNGIVLKGWSGGALSESSGDSIVLRWTNSGNVGIGTTAPERLLSVGTAPSSGLYITRAGNAGVGTTAPAYELDVTGDIRSTGTIYGDLAGNLTGGYAAAGWVDDGGVVRLETDADNVGIGLTNPNAKLQVNGTINATAMNVGANAVLDEGTSFAGDVTGPWDSLEIASGV
ncbi:MAG: hypothetical protein MJA29_01085, partial [Candidatus Omnitrophica bacterium]|nr:hypothetical protein [Candidatus Omnitrophota bacterium]